MKTLVIGNGFDLAHDLPTRYEDFLDFLQMAVFVCNKYPLGLDNKNNYKEIPDALNKYGEEIGAKNGLSALFYDWIVDRENFFSVLGIGMDILNIKNGNLWANYFLEKNANGKIGGINWIDFELEISNVIRRIEFLYKNVSVNQEKSLSIKIFNTRLLYEFMNTENDDIIFHEKDFLDFLLKKLQGDLEKFISSLEQYIGFVSQLPVTKNVIDIEEIQKEGPIDNIICFNYTDTFRKKYSNDMDDGKIDFVHGMAHYKKNEESHIVLGTEETLSDINEVNEKLDCIHFKKYFQRIYKRTGLRYKNNLPERPKEQEKSDGLSKRIAYFFGHSLSFRDGDIIKYVVENTDKSVFFYRDEKQHTQLIASLVRIVGKDKVIEHANRNFEFRLQKTR